MLAVRVRLYLDWLTDPNSKSKSKYSKVELNFWFNVMAKSDRFVNRELENIVRIAPRGRGRNKNPLGAIATPDQDDHYFFCGTPPPPKRRRSLLGGGGNSQARGHHSDR